MKVPMVILALLAFSSVVMTQEGTIKTQGKQAPIEQYTYATHLDVAKVISEDQVPDVCGVAPMRRTYKDSNGKQHELEYEVMGSGYSNG